MDTPEFLEFKERYKITFPVEFSTFNDKELFKQYVMGKRIRLDHMDDEYPVESGTEGTIDHVDGIGQIHVKWDNGRTLAVIPNVDKFIIL